MDGWRAVAILLMLGDHLQFATHLPAGLAYWTTRIGDGNLGMRLFFVLSGFLISLLLLQEAGRHGRISLRHFFMRRALRILPVQFAYLAVLGALVLAGVHQEKATSWVGCLTFTRNFIGHLGGTTHFWSLSVEEQFYALWPAALATFALWKSRTRYCGLLLVPILLGPWIRYFLITDAREDSVAGRLLNPFSILAHLDFLSVGCLAAWWTWKRPGLWVWERWHGWGLYLLLAGIVVGRVAQLAPVGPGLQAWIPLLQASALACCLRLTTHPQSPGYWLLNTRVMAGLGQLSYSIYVWHMLFVARFIGPPISNLAVCDWRLWLWASLATACASYWWLEQPLTAWRQRWRN